MILLGVVLIGIVGLWFHCADKRAQASAQGLAAARAEVAASQRRAAAVRIPIERKRVARLRVEAEQRGDFAESQRLLDEYMGKVRAWEGRS